VKLLTFQAGRFWWKSFNKTAEKKPPTQQRGMNHTYPCITSRQVVPYSSCFS
jgi:hypothetical protein